MPKKQNQVDIVQAAKKLDPKDNSLEARQLRETAEDIQDHWESEAASKRDTN